MGVAGEETQYPDAVYAGDTAGPMRRREPAITFSVLSVSSVALLV
jgi:hypothetical protein